MKDLASILEETFKTKTRAVENPLITSVGVTAAQILANNPNRLAWVIVNMSANTIYLAFSNAVSATRGIILAPNGGSASMVYNEDFQPTGWAVWALASGAASAVYAYEVVTQ